MSHLYEINRLVSDDDHIYSTLPQDKLKEVIKKDLVRTLAREVENYTTIIESYNTERKETIYKARVAIIPTIEYKELMQELGELREFREVLGDLVTNNQMVCPSCSRKNNDGSNWGDCRKGQKLSGIPLEKAKKGQAFGWEEVTHD